MYSKKTVIISQAGLFGKSASKFIRIANNFKSTLFIEYDNKRANAKSLLGILSLALPGGCEIVITGNGVDEHEAVDKLTRFIASGFINEEENNEEAVVGDVKPGK
ncbi:MAG: HPr family phosphocarrier protein [Clostridia bacterium]|jgi:phosphotransferase system HPr (HPr) family protein|nr:HPr family phosphocarrier protein [Clostridia bacterium]